MEAVLSCNAEALADMSSQELQALLHAIASGPGLALLARGMAKGLGQDPEAIWPVAAEQDVGRPLGQEPASAVDDAHGPGKSSVAHEVQCKLPTVCIWQAEQQQCLQGWSQVVRLKPLGGICGRACGCVASIAEATMGMRMAKATKQIDVPFDRSLWDFCALRFTGNLAFSTCL